MMRTRALAGGEQLLCQTPLFWKKAPMLGIGAPPWTWPTVLTVDGRSVQGHYSMAAARWQWYPG